METPILLIPRFSAVALALSILLPRIGLDILRNSGCASISVTASQNLLVRALVLKLALRCARSCVE